MRVMRDVEDVEEVVAVVLVEFGEGGEAFGEAVVVDVKVAGVEPAGKGSGGLLPVSRGPDAVVGDLAGEESVALLGGVSGGRVGDRLGHAGRGGVVPSRGRAVA